MNVGELLVWEATNGLLLIPVVIGFVILVRWLRGRPVFTERDWLFLFGHERRELLRVRFWLRFVAILAFVVAFGLAISFYVLPYGTGWFAGGLLLAIAVVVLIAPWWLH